MLGSIIWGVLVAPIIFFFLLGLIAKKAPFRWSNVCKAYLAILFVGLGIWGHIVNQQGMLALIPPWWPLPEVGLFVTGLLEIAFGVLLWTKWQRQTGIVIIV